MDAATKEEGGPHFCLTRENAVNYDGKETKLCQNYSKRLSTLVLHLKGAFATFYILQPTGALATFYILQPKNAFEKALACVA